MHQPSRTSLIRSMTVGVAVAALLLGACASKPMAPTESLLAAQEAIASAEQADARQFAGAELDEAQQQLEAAERAVSDEKMIEADRLARQSRVVAELASARAASAKATEINREMGRGADALSEEMQRTGDQQ